MINKEVFQKVIDEWKFNEVKDNFVFFVQNAQEKTSAKGNKYLLIETQNQTSQIQKYFFFGTAKVLPKSGNFIYAHIEKLGDNWKIDRIWNVVEGQKYMVEQPDCKNCMWNGQTVCEKCKDGSYFQEIEKQEPTADINRTQAIQADFVNEEEVVDVNNYFEQKPEAEEFWKEYDQNKKTR